MTFPKPDADCNDEMLLSLAGEAADRLMRVVGQSAILGDQTKMRPHPPSEPFPAGGRRSASE
jgi:hypothetical protein